MSWWFAPRLSGEFTRDMLRPIGFGWFYGGCFLWIFTAYIYLMILMLQYTLWLMILSAIWAVQLLVVIGIGTYAGGRKITQKIKARNG